MSDRRAFWQELRRRHVVRAAVGHIVFFWLLVQVADVVLPYVGVVENPVRWAFVAGVALFPVTLIAAWFIEHPWHKYTSSRLALDLIVIVAIGVLTATWVIKNIPQAIHARTSIVVMPFHYDADNQREQFLSRAFALQINSLLMKSRSIDVVGYESANSALLEGLDILGIARKLGVKHVLSGVISSAGGSMQLSVRLDDHAGNELWSTSLQDSIDNLPAVQEQIAAQVQARIGESGAGVSVAAAAARECPMPSDSNALERYFTARHYLESRTESEQSRAELRKAAEIFEGLIRDYPDFAQAYSALAWTLNYQVTYDPEGRDRRAVREAASKLGRQGYERCDRLGEALVLFGNQADDPNPYINDEQNLALWMEMQPESTEAVEKYTFHLGFTGRSVERVRLAERNYRLNPLSVRAIKMLVSAYMNEGRLDEAVELEKRAFELGSTAPSFAAEAKARALCQGELDCVLDNFPAEFAPFREQLKSIYATPTDGAEAQQAVETAVRLVEMSQGAALNWFNGSTCAYDHLTPLFFRLWDQSRENHWFWFWPNAWSEDCANVWESDEFPRVLEEAGLVEYFKAKKWPDACRPEGQSFSCSQAIWDASHAGAQANAIPVAGG